MYEHLFSPVRVGSITLKNRYAVGPMGGRFFMYGMKGEYTENGIEYLIARARGGFGLIVTGSNVADLTVDPWDPMNGKPNPMYAPSYFGYSSKMLIDRVHDYGCKIFLQISMGPGRIRDGKAPSAIPRFKDPSVMAEEMTVEEIETKIAAMVKMAVQAKKWGYDGVEIHGMHWGYLLDQFAMAYTNHRTDEYGGDLDGRLTLIRKIITGIKEACGKDYPLSVRMNMKTYMADFNKPTLDGTEEVGRTIEEAVEIAKRFEQYGVDLINCNSGSYDAFFYCVSPYYMPKGYNIHLARQLKAAVNIPIFVAGGMDDPVMCEKAIADGDIDGVTLARASLCDPAYPQKVEMGRLEKIRPCISCTNCIFTNEQSGTPLCSSNPTAMQEKSYACCEPAGTRKKVIVVGGGVAGMEAARTAKLRGHDVELYEKSAQLGGHLIEAGSHPFKQGIYKLNKWYQNELSELGVPVHISTELTPEMIIDKHPDTVVLAVGSDHFMPAIPGIDHEKSVCCYDVLVGNKTVGDKVTVVGGGLTGCELAYELAAYQGKEVTVVEAMDNVLSAGAPVPTSVKTMLLELLKRFNVRLETAHRIKAVNDEGAVITDRDGVDSVLYSDNIVFAIGLKPNKSMKSQLAGHGIEVYEVGDGIGVGNIRTCVSAAYEIAKGI